MGLFRKKLDLDDLIKEKNLLLAQIPVCYQTTADTMWHMVYRNYLMNRNITPRMQNRAYHSANRELGKYVGNLGGQK